MHNLRKRFFDPQGMSYWSRRKKIEKYRFLLKRFVLLRKRRFRETRHSSEALIKTFLRSWIAPLFQQQNHSLLRRKKDKGELIYLSPDCLLNPELKCDILRVYPLVFAKNDDGVLGIALIDDRYLGLAIVGDRDQYPEGVLPTISSGAWRGVRKGYYNRYTFNRRDYNQNPKMCLRFDNTSFLAPIL